MVISAPMEDSPAVSVTGSSSASVIWKPIDSGTPAWTRIPAQSTNSGGAEGLGLGVVSSGRVSAAAGPARPVISSTATEAAARERPRPRRVRRGRERSGVCPAAMVMLSPHQMTLGPVLPAPSGGTGNTG
ncbi:hypothetical protein GCM10025784_22470 [Citricoccus nitrophenolicus]